MDFKTFKRILTAFADTPASIDATKGKLICEIHNDMIEAEVVNRDGDIVIKEQGNEYRAAPWLLNRVARMPLLADRILAAVSEAECFISPTAVLTNQLDDTSTTPESFGDAVSLSLDMLNQRPAGTSSVVYLTSDAGEGKTTLINHLARIQAERFKRKESDWLLVPIALGGRPFLRFDDLVVGFMSNRLRFPMFYFDGFMELVKLGVIIPAFDGFEEMFVVNASGDALSAVGNLMRTLDSSGTVLIAARKAYFDYQDVRMQARLFDSIGTCSVAFSRISLERWKKPQFLDYCDKRCIDQGEAIHNEVAARLKDEQHPLLTRAVLVKRLLNVAEEDGGLAELLEQLGHSPTDYFSVFVNAILEREAQEKWIDASGEAAKPLLKVSEHVELLSSVALEMWLLSTESVKVDLLDTIAELFCETRNLPAAVAAQIKERIKQHALIVGTNGGQQTFAFDHDEFRNFFLGEAVGRLCGQANAKARAELLTLLRKGSLPLQAAEAAVGVVRRSGEDHAGLVAEFLQEVAGMDGPTSFTQENVARLILKVLHKAKVEGFTLRGLAFGEDSLRDLSLAKVTFEECRFATLSLENTNLEQCSFDRCHFDRITLHEKTAIRNCVIKDCQITCVQTWGKEDAVFVPGLIPARLRVAGFEMPVTQVESNTPADVPEDAGMKLLRKLVRGFRQKTYMNENVVLRRLSDGAETFLKRDVPSLIKAGILTKERNERDKQDRYHLNVSMQRIEEVLAGAPKTLAAFISEFANGNK